MLDPVSHAHCPHCERPFTPHLAMPPTELGSVRECACGAYVEMFGTLADNCAVLFATFDPAHPTRLEPIPHCRNCHADLVKVRPPEQVEQTPEQSVPPSFIEAHTAPPKATPKRKPAGGGIVL